MRDPLADQDVRLRGDCGRDVLRGESRACLNRACRETRELRRVRPAAVRRGGDWRERGRFEIEFGRQLRFTLPPRTLT